MGILTEDDSLIDAALSEILALPLEERRARDPQGDVTYLLVRHSLAQVSFYADRIRNVTMTFPSG